MIVMVREDTLMHHTATLCCEVITRDSNDNDD